MRIGEVASLTGLNVSNIRFYERKGLLTPDREEDSKYRDYTQEDIRRIKQILLYRKMGISVETIYLLLNGQADRQDVLRRQKEELLSQMENLQGAIDLCGLVLADGELDGEKLDKYLSYVHEEEEKGRRFAEAEELLEEFTEFTKLNLFRGDPYVGRLFRNPWVARILALAIPLVFVYEIIVLVTGGHNMGRVLFWAALLAVYFTDFALYRRAKKKYEEEA